MAPEEEPTKNPIKKFYAYEQEVTVDKISSTYRDETRDFLTEYEVSYTLTERTSYLIEDENGNALGEGEEVTSKQYAIL